jgi:hypothetical protein
MPNTTALQFLHCLPGVTAQPWEHYVHIVRTCYEGIRLPSAFPQLHGRNLAKNTEKVDKIDNEC